MLHLEINCTDPHPAMYLSEQNDLLQKVNQEEENLLGKATSLIEEGHAKAADALLTEALLYRPRDSKLWLAAGIARWRRGAYRSASSAFEMCVWLSDDQEARLLLDICRTALPRDFEI